MFSKYGFLCYYNMRGMSFIFQHNPRTRCAFPSDVMLPSVRTFCGIPFLDLQRNLQFRWTVPVKRINPELLLVFVQKRVPLLVLRF